jgi:flagellar basal-body rod protein FlgF/flagellar basal-body rod protein FlgG
MDSGLYAAYTALLSRTQALDTAANNLANADTSGFRAEKDYFRGTLVDNLGGFGGDSQVGETVNNFGVLGGSMLDFGQGQFQATGNALDLALRGDGFFAIQTARGVRYTRDGSFTRSASGVLQTGEGENVLDPQGQPITIPTGTIVVADDGTVSVTTATTPSTVVGRVGVYAFPDKRVLQAEGSNRFSAPADLPVNLRPVAGTATVAQGGTEGSNEDSIQGTMQLVLLQRQTEMMQKALSVFYTEFDKTAAEELGKV